MQGRRLVFIMLTILTMTTFVVGCAAVNGEVEPLEDEIAELRAQTEDMVEQELYEERVGELEQAREQLHTAETEKTELQETVDGLELRLVEQAEEKQALQSEIDSREADLASKQNQIEQLREERDQLQQSLQTQLDETGEAEQLTEEIEELNETIEALESRVMRQNQIIQELEEKVEDIEEKERRLEELREENLRLEESLSEIMEADARHGGQGVVVTLDSEILFELGSDELVEQARYALDKLAEIVEEHADRPIVVEGHTCTVPLSPGAPFQTNWHLSAARAISVVEYLVETHGLPAEQFLAGGHGEYRPIKPNDTAENRARNQRVEIVFLPPELEQQILHPEFE